jgi:hypothetical protein
VPSYLWPYWAGPGNFYIPSAFWWLDTRPWMSGTV